MSVEKINFRQSDPEKTTQLIEMINGDYNEIQNDLQQEFSKT